AAQISKALPGPGQDRLGRLEALPRLHPEAEAVGIDPRVHPQLAELVLLRLHPEIAAVDQGNAPALSPVLPAVLLTHNHEWIVLVGGSSPAAADGVDAVAHPDPPKTSLHQMSSGKIEQVVIGIP